jgi:hypothetical protein
MDITTVFGTVVPGSNPGGSKSEKDRLSDLSLLVPGGGFEPPRSSSELDALPAELPRYLQLYFSQFGGP